MSLNMLFDFAVKFQLCLLSLPKVLAQMFRSYPYPSFISIGRSSMVG